MKKVYLDANATTRVYPEVLEDMLPFLRERYGNPSSVHATGREAKKYMETARRQVAGLIGAVSPEEVYFTSGGTESDNMAIKGAVLSTDKGRHIITSSVDHSAVFNVCKSLEKEGFEVTYLDVDPNGMIDLGLLEESIREDTVLITVMAANNETGTIMPLEEIGGIAGQRGVFFHTDAVQIVGKKSFDASGIQADMVSISAHKIHGPKGVGALYVKKGTSMGTVFQGGAQEKGMRAGTENIPGIIGFGKACEIARGKGVDDHSEIKELRDFLQEALVDIYDKARVNGHPIKRLPNTLNVSFPGIDGAAIVMALDIEGICVSTGAACTSGNVEPSRVLTSMGLDEEEVRGAVRFSLDSYAKKEDLEHVIEVMKRILGRVGPKKTQK